MYEARSWARLGGWLGVAWPILSIIVMAVAEIVGPRTHSVAEELAALGQPRVGHVSMLLHSAIAVIGLIGIGWAVALNVVLQAERPSRAATLAAIFGVAGFTLVMAMLIVQGSVQTGIAEQYGKLSSDADRAATLAAFRAVRWVDLGLDFTWDIFIAWCMILFGAAMLRSQTFGKVWGSLGIALAALLFALDVWNAPHPAEPDISPISFVWFVGISIKMLLFYRRDLRQPTEQIAAVAAP